MSLQVRDAGDGDIAALHAIYSHHVLHGFGTFDEAPPSVDDFADKWRGVVAVGLPWLVAVDGGEIAGFSYASPFRPRTGYRYTVEDSVYVRNDARGRGLGKALLLPLIERCVQLGARQVVAVIGDSQNTASIALHLKAGFQHSGVIKGAGRKLGRWVDIVLMQRALNGGDETQPPLHGAWRAA